MLGHYRTDREWSDEILGRGKSLLARLREVLGRQAVPDYRSVIGEMISELANDLNTPAALDRLDKYLESALEGDEEMNPGELSRFLDSVLGLAV